MAPVLVTLYDLEGHSQVAGLLKCNPSNICAVFYQISTDSVLARSLSDSWASCRYIASYLSLFANFNLPSLHFAPPLGMTPFEFRKDFWHQKTRVPGLSCSVVCVILHLAILVEHRLVEDRHTQTQTDTGPWHIPRSKNRQIFGQVTVKLVDCFTHPVQLFPALCCLKGADLARWLMYNGQKLLYCCYFKGRLILTLVSTNTKIL